MHMMSKSDVIQEEKETIRKPRKFCTIIAANDPLVALRRDPVVVNNGFRKYSEGINHYEVTVYVRDMDMFITVRFTSYALARKLLRRTLVFLRMDMATTHMNLK